VDRHDLIEFRRRVCIERDGCAGRDTVGVAAHIGNDDVVAEPVHLGEGCCAGHGVEKSHV
jgi:hypothetical protein